MARKRKKGLSEDDKAIWDQVAATVTPMHNRPKRLHPEDEALPPKPKPAPARPMHHVPNVVKPQPVHQHPSVHVHHHSSLEDRFGNPVPRMDRKLYTKMRKGKLSPDARIDLHGMTMARAHTALRGFILRAHSEGLRLVLVITGKGSKNPRAESLMPDYAPGILRHSVPDWLQSPPLGGLVMQITQAHQSHGGTGAYYVYLRKRR